MIVSFSGIDGSGKTTICKMLPKVLTDAGVEVIYRHEYDYFVLKYLFKIFGGRAVENQRKTFLSTYSKKTILHRIWPYLVLLDGLLLYTWLKITKRKSVVILDRYLYDQLVSFEGLGVVSNQLRNLYLKAPRPDVSIVLYTEPTMAYERKKQTHTYEVSFYAQGIKHYLEIASKVGLPMIKTNSSLDETFHSVVGILLSNMKFRDMLTRKALYNRVIYKAVIEHDLRDPAFSRVYSYYEHKVQKVKKTLSFINDLMDESESDWLLMKSYYPFAYVPTYDLDILIRPEGAEKVKAVLRSKSIPYSDDEEEGKINIRMPGYYVISIHLGVSWEGIYYTSSEFIWKDPQLVMWYGERVWIPNKEAELLIHSAHILFELSFIRLCDVLYISELLESDLDWESVLVETNRYNWQEGFLELVRVIRKLRNDYKLGSVRVPIPVPYTLIVSNFARIILKEIRAHTISRQRIREYARELLRFAIWNIGSRAIRPPFGELLESQGPVNDVTQENKFSDIICNSQKL